jgi:hypothetical protein
MSSDDSRRAGQGGTVRLQDFAAFKYWNDWVANLGSVWTEQLNDLSATWEHIQKGEYPASRWLPDAARLWASWAKAAEKLGTLPLQWSQASERLPVALFVLDGAAETTDPQEVTIATRRRVEGPLHVTALHGGSGQVIPRKLVRVRRVGNGDGIGIKLVDLGQLRQEGRQGGGLRPGQYSGAVYIREQARNIPVALVQALVEDDAEPDAPADTGGSAGAGAGAGPRDDAGSPSGPKRASTRSRAR